MSETRTLKVIVVGNAKSAEKALRGLSAEGDRTSTKFDSIGSKVGGAFASIAKGAAVGLGAAAAATAVIGVKAAAQAEQNEMALTTILGNAEKAKAFLEDINQFAAKTPFDLPTLTDAAKRLTAVGTETGKVLPIMEALGDATSGMGTGAEGISRAVTALTQMRVKGKVTGEEMLQLAEAGIPAWEALASQLGVSTSKVQDMVSKGKVSVDSLYKAIENKQGATFQKLDGMMDKQSQTVSGMWSTLKDTFEQGAGNIMKAFFPLIQDNLPKLIRLTEKVSGAIALFTGNADSAKGSIGPLGTYLKEIGTTLGNIGQKIMAVVGPAFKEIGGLIKNDLAPAFMQLLPKIMPVVKFLINMFGGAVVGVIKGLVGIIKGAINIITGIIKVFTGLLTGNWKKAWEGVKQILKGALQAIWGAIQVWWNGSILGIFKRGIFNLLGVFKGGWANIKGAFTSGMSGIKTAVVAGWNTSLAFLKGIPGTIKSVFSGAAKWLVSAGGDVISGLLAGLDNAKQWVADKIGEIANMIPDKFKSMLEIFSPSRVMKRLGVNVVEGIVEGLKESKGIKKLSKAMTKVSRMVIDAFKDKDISADQRDDLLSIIDRQEKRVEKAVKKRLRLADRLERASERLTASQKRLGALKDARNALVDSTFSASRGYAKVTNLWGSGEFSEANDAASLLYRFRERLGHIEKFKANLGKLAGKGLSNSMLNEIAGQGPDQGGLLAAELLKRTDLIDNFNAVDRRINVVSSALATQAGNRTYKTSIDAARDRVRNQRETVVSVKVDVRGNVTAERDLAKSIAKTVRDEISRDDKRNGR